jgi:DHA1 family multidrug resistance protein-like MFS transporter
MDGNRLAYLWRTLSSPIGVLLVLSFLVTFGLTNFESVFGLYSVERYAYGPQQVGLVLTVVGLISAIMQGRRFDRRFGELKSLRSLLCSALGFV